jgi:dimethylargininase
MHALVREVSPRLAQCELTYLERTAIDAQRAALQHREYTQALQSLGCTLEWLPPLPQCPDGVFVEDTAVVLPEIAVVTRPGATSRRSESASVALSLGQRARISVIAEPGCLEGGDVLHVARTLHIGASGRTNAAGIAQLTALLRPSGYRVAQVSLTGCLHLKSACSFIPPEVLLVNPHWVDPATFGPLRVIEVDEREPHAANTLTIGGTTLMSAAYPHTRDRLEAVGVGTRALEVSELHKAEGGVTCMSLLLA